MKFLKWISDRLKPEVTEEQDEDLVTLVVQYDIDPNGLYVWKIIDGPYLDRDVDGFPYMWADVLAQSGETTQEVSIVLASVDHYQQLLRHLRSPTLMPYELDKGDYQKDKVEVIDIDRRKS